MSCVHLQLGVEHLAEAGGEAAEVAVPLLHLRLQTPLELAAEELLLAGEVDDALLHPRELRRQELLELGALRVDRRVGAAKYISIFTKLFVHTSHPIYEQDMMVKVKVVLLKCIPIAGPQGNLPPQ